MSVAGLVLVSNLRMDRLFQIYPKTFAPSIYESPDGRKWPRELLESYEDGTEETLP